MTDTRQQQTSVVVVITMIITMIIIMIIIIIINYSKKEPKTNLKIQGGSNMTGTDLYVNKPHCAAAVRP